MLVCSMFDMMFWCSSVVFFVMLVVLFVYCRNVMLLGLIFCGLNVCCVFFDSVVLKCVNDGSCYVGIIFFMLCMM